MALGLVVAVAAAVAAATFSGAGRVGMMLPVAAALGLGATLVAFARFERFVLLVIVGRATLDVAKLGSSSVDATGALSVLFIAAAAVWMYREGAKVDAPAADEIVIPFTVFFLAGLASVAFSAHPLQSALEAVRIGTVVAILVALSRIVTTPRRRTLLLGAVLASAVVPLGAAAMQASGGGGLLIRTGLSRINGTFLHPNPFGAYLFLVLVLIVAVFPHVPAWWRWLALAPLTLASGGALLLTYSRGAWAAATVGVIVIGILQSRRLLGMIVVGAVLIAITVPSVAVRLSDLDQQVAESGASGNSLAWRFSYWGEVLDLQRDPILGIGLREVELTEEAEKAPHNDFVRVYVETGLVGLAAYLWLLVSMFLAGRAALARARPGIERGLAVAFLATLSGLVVLSLVANVVSQLVILWYFVAIMVLALANVERPVRPQPVADA